MSVWWCLFVGGCVCCCRWWMRTAHSHQDKERCIRGQAQLVTWRQKTHMRHEQHKNKEGADGRGGWGLRGSRICVAPVSLQSGRDTWEHLSISSESSTSDSPLSWSLLLAFSKGKGPKPYAQICSTQSIQQARILKFEMHIVKGIYISIPLPQPPSRDENVWERRPLHLGARLLPAQDTTHYLLHTMAFLLSLLLMISILLLAEPTPDP